MIAVFLKVSLGRGSCNVAGPQTVKGFLYQEEELKINFQCCRKIKLNSSWLESD